MLSGAPRARMVAEPGRLENKALPVPSLCSVFKSLASAVGEGGLGRCPGGSESLCPLHSAPRHPAGPRTAK